MNIFNRVFPVIPILSTIIISAYLFALPSKTAEFKAEPLNVIEASVQEPGATPTHITIDKINLSLKVNEASVSSNDWELYEDAASYLKTSGKIGNKGNTVIYAHNKNYLFGQLKNLNLGDAIKITTDQNTEKLFIVREKKVVSPSEVSIVYPTDDQRITLFTCTNFLDADRLVIVATPATTFSDIL